MTCDARCEARSFVPTNDIQPIASIAYIAIVRQSRAAAIRARSAESVLSFSSTRFLIGELLLGKLSETVVVVGNAPHDRPGFLVSHLIGNRASFLCTKAPMLRIPETNFLHRITSHQLAYSGDLPAAVATRRAALPDGGAGGDPLQLSKNSLCFSNMRRLPSSASSSDSAISERWPVSSACFTITRWRATWTANSAICRLTWARCAKRNQTCAWTSRIARLSF